MSKNLRTAGIAAVMVAVVAGTAACGSGDDQEPVTTVTSYVTAGSTPPRETPTSAAPTSPAGGSRALQASYATLRASLPSATSVALAPVGGGRVVVLGDKAPQVAWSTIKVPLAIAAERKGGPNGATTAAIVSSDNASAEALWASLGSPEQAAAAVTEVLREGGDRTTTVPSQKLRPEFTTFGQTTWPTSSAATFTANLPCMSGGSRILDLMGRVAGNQQWGVETVRARATAVKGGWGPSADGGYVVRQIGVLTLDDGRQVAVAMGTHAPGASMDSGVAVLNRVAQWLQRNLASLPAGRCK